VQPPNHQRLLFASSEARRLSQGCVILLLLLALLANARVLGFGFLYLRDDDINLALNPHMGALSAARLHWMFTDFSYVRRYIPLGWLGFSATYTVAGLDPAPYHAVSLALLLLNTALVYALVQRAVRLLGPRRLRGGLDSWSVGAGALAAAWWALSPMRVETTAWVSGNLYGQAAALLFFSIIAYLRTYETSGARRALYLALSAVLYAASLLTYPLALGVPVLLAGLDVLRAREAPRPALGRLLAEKAVFLVPLAGVLAVTLWARVAASALYGGLPGGAQFPLASRAAQAAYVALYYLAKPWWPTGLSPLYDRLIGFNPWSPLFVAAVAAASAISALALARARRAPALAVLWFGYLACAAPFFGLTETSHMTSDRYSYLLSALAAAVLAALLSMLAGRAARLAATSALAALCLFFAAQSRAQLRIWATDRAQHAYVAGRLTNPGLLDDFRSRMAILEFMRGDEAAPEKAVAERLARASGDAGFLRAARIMDDKRRLSGYYGKASLLAIMHEQMGIAFARAGELREADDHMETALRMGDGFYQAAYDRAFVLIGLGRPEDALDSFLAAESWAPAPLPRNGCAAFLGDLASQAAADGKPRLEAAARAAARRL
jgi:hypothetical protein